MHILLQNFYQEEQEDVVEVEIEEVEVDLEEEEGVVVDLEEDGKVTCVCHLFDFR